MSAVYEKLMKCLESVRARVDFQPEVALVLGSGLGDYAEEIEIKATLDYHEIEGFPVSTIPGHKGRFVFGYVGKVPVVIMQGRVHFYEGYPIQDVVLPIRLMKLMGAKTLFLTNAAGGVNGNFHAGDFMLVNDQISTFVPSPLIGENIDAVSYTHLGGVRLQGTSNSRIYEGLSDSNRLPVCDRRGTDLPVLPDSGPGEESYHPFL